MAEPKDEQEARDAAAALAQQISGGKPAEPGQPGKPAEPEEGGGEEDDVAKAIAGLDDAGLAELEALVRAAEAAPYPNGELTAVREFFLNPSRREVRHQRA